MPRRRLTVVDVRRKYEESEDDDNPDEDARASPRCVLPQLASAKKVHRSQRERGDSVQAHPAWMASARASRSIVRAGATTRSKKERPSASSLSLLDEQMLILCRSAMQQSRAEDSEPRQLMSQQTHELYGHESIYAATQVQRLFRGVSTRQRLAAANGPRFQRAASRIQFALRRVVVARRVFERWTDNRHRYATRIQAWFRGCRCRDQLVYERARAVIDGITRFQRRFRGYRFWNLVAALLLQRRSHAATQIQRCQRGAVARRLVLRLRQEQLRFARELQQMSDLHRVQARCDGCRPDHCTEETLFVCFMVRFVGLHDLAGAKTLGLEGIQAFPSSARFCFMYSVLLQAMGDELEISMAFLGRARTTLGLNDDDVLECERRYLFPALQLSAQDAAVLLDLAIVSQSRGKTARAASFYRLVLNQPPADYSIPGYLHRVDLLDRLVLNHHRFCSIFDSRQVKVLVKVVPLAKRGETVRVMVARLNHFTIILSNEEDDATCRFNAVYLSDDEVCELLAKPASDEDSGEHEPKPAPTSSSRDLASSRSNIQRDSTRRGSKLTTRQGGSGQSKEQEHAKENVLAQLFQNEFRGLHIKPTTFSKVSEARSRLRITRDHAERLLRELIFLDPQAETGPIIESSEQQYPAGMGSVSAAPPRVALVPSVVRIRMARRLDVVRSHAVVNLQRMVRGFRVRARIRRETLLRGLQRQQVDQLYAKLHRNFQIRDKRRRAAIAIQRICKGVALRRLLARWRRAAGTIQRVVRGHRGRKRAIAFRDGNLTFYMAERVFQRGVRISGQSIFLVIERCGLSFRMQGYAMDKCIVYPGFATHDSIMALVRYENWSYAQRLARRDVWLRGTRAVIESVAFVNQDDGQCVLSCRFDGASDGRLVSLFDCIQAINLRNMATVGRDAEPLPLPLTPSDTDRIVARIVDKLALVAAIPMATKELQKQTPGSFILTIMPPPKVHYTFSKTGSSAIQLSRHPAVAQNQDARLSTALARQLAFPVVDGYRGVSIGGELHLYRKKCRRHAVHFTKCRCVLPLVKAPAYVEALALAMAPPPPPRYFVAGSPSPSQHHVSDPSS